MRAIAVTDREAGQRLDKLLGKYLDLAPKGFIYKMLRKKNITLNGKKAEGNEILSAGDEVRAFLSEETFAKFSGRAAAYSASSGISRMQGPQVVVQKLTMVTSHAARSSSVKLPPSRVTAENSVSAA